MSGSKHTPGPWKVAGDLSTWVTDAQDNNIADCGYSVILDLAEKQANARAVAALPDLFDAARKVIDQRTNGGWLVNGPNAIEALDELEAALSKAEARS